MTVTLEPQSLEELFHPVTLHLRVNPVNHDQSLSTLAIVIVTNHSLSAISHLKPLEHNQTLFPYSSIFTTFEVQPSLAPGGVENWP